MPRAQATRLVTARDAAFADLADIQARGYGWDARSISQIAVAYAMRSMELDRGGAL
ncbi:hypothetical protein [Paracoccus litorisediminis]|uniref:hypothetical protein n=1 Tax=Paracoccus litorisediminis TaxID=2006130 RepID=UPI0031B5C551